MAANKEEILNTIANMTILEVVDLVKMMEEKFGVTAAAPVAMAAAAPAAAAAAPPPAPGIAAIIGIAAVTPNFSSIIFTRLETSSIVMPSTISSTCCSFAALTFCFLLGRPGAPLGV